MTTLDEVAAIDKPAVYLDSQGMPYYRMSALGMCSKALIALRQGYQPMSPPKSMQQRYDDGHLHEPDILRRLGAEFGWVEQWGHQDEVVVKLGSTARLIGHIDCRAMSPVTGEPCVVDAKTASKDAFVTWEKITTGDDLREKFPYYWWQMGAYLSAEEHRDWQTAVFAVKNKNDGRMIVKLFERNDFPNLGGIVQRVMAIENGSAEDLPMACDKASFPCPVWYLHEDEAPVKIGDQFDLATVEQIEALATVFAKARRDKAAAEKVEKETKEELLRLLGDTKTVQTDRWSKVTQYEGTSVSFDKAKLAEDHPEIDLDKYKKTSKYPAIRLTEREV